jgi:hypothetical protein
VVEAQRVWAEVERGFDFVRSVLPRVKVNG